MRKSIEALMVMAGLFSLSAQASLILDSSNEDLNLSSDQDVVLVRNEFSPNEVRFQIHTVYDDVCVDWGNREKCGISSVRCGQNCRLETVCRDVPDKVCKGTPPNQTCTKIIRHECHNVQNCWARECCWSEVFCQETANLPVQEKNRAVIVRFEGKVAAGETETFRLNYWKTKNQFLFVRWNIKRFFDLNQMDGSTARTITKIAGDGESDEWIFSVK